MSLIPPPSVLSPSFDSLAGVPVNVNAPNFVQNFANAIENCSIIVPQGVQQIGSFAFDYRESEEVDLENELSVHYLEDNTAVSDHIAIRPDVVALTGYVAELTMPSGLLALLLSGLQAATNGLSQLPIFLGAKTPGAVQKLEQAISQAQSVVVQVEQAVARAAQIANALSGLLSGPARNKQQAAYLQLRALRDAGILFTIVTPFQTHYNMAIRSLRATNPKETKEWSKFIVVLQQVNIIGTGQPDYAANLSSPVASAQGQASTSVGATAGAAAGSVGSVLSIGAAQ